MSDLPGGHVNAVVRIGNTVRRPLSERHQFVHALLRHLERSGWHSAPRFLGVDDGCEVLTFIDGHVAWEPEQPPGVWTDDSLMIVAKLIRQFHDLTAGTPFAAGEEVVFHNDLSPRNTVYRESGNGFRPVAFIDWDLAAPGQRLHDVALMCWQFLDLGPQRPSASEPARLVRLMTDAYGIDDRSRLVETILWWQDRCWRGIAARAEAGDPAMVRLRSSGAIDHVRAALAWVEQNRSELESALI